MRNKSIGVIALIFLVVLVVAIRYEKFGFTISSGKAKVEVKGEQRTAQDGEVSPGKPSEEKYSTQGDQSPIVNNQGGSSVINYGNK